MTDKSSPADNFIAMAERIRRNDPKEFQGAFLIVSPDGTVQSHAFFDPEGDEMAFWSFVSSVVQVASTEAQTKMEDKIRMMGMGGMPRR
ncbi:MAG: hypothetical protein E6R03_12950 [Hyphomicrobiaceae bacterium]|nr:MAG: hypothetical protein E6R03_12950 [Hyphomicrobiaceae bacterium]